MKKLTLTILAIVFCCACVFAADVAASVALYISYGDEGFSIVTNKGLWEPMIGMSVSDDMAGGSLKLNFRDWGQTVELETSVWSKPDLDLRFKGAKSNKISNIFSTSDFNKLTIGTKSIASFKNGVSIVDAMGFVEYEQEFDGNSYKLGMAYKPVVGSASNSSSFFIAGEFNHIYKERNLIHADGLTKLNFENGKASLEYSLAEVDWSLVLGANNSVIQKQSLAQKFDCDERYYFARRNYGWIAKGGVVRNIGSTTTAGLRYKYYANDDGKNGLYGYGLMTYSKDDSYYEVESEVGLGGAKIELGNIISKGPFSEFSYFLIDFDYGKDKATDIRLSDVYASATYSADNFAPYIKIHYLDESSPLYTDIYSSDEYLTGFFVKTGLTHSISADAVDTGVVFGVDDNKNFKWQIQNNNTINL